MAESVFDLREECEVLTVEVCEPSFENERRLLTSRILQLQCLNQELESQRKVDGFHGCSTAKTSDISNTNGGTTPEVPISTSDSLTHCSRQNSVSETSSKPTGSSISSIRTTRHTTHEPQESMEITNGAEEAYRKGHDRDTRELEYWKKRFEECKTERAECLNAADMARAHAKQLKEQVGQLMRLMELKEEEKRKEFLAAVDARTKLLETEKERDHLACEVVTTKSMLYEIQQNFSKDWWQLQDQHAHQKQPTSSPTDPRRHSSSLNALTFSADSNRTGTTVAPTRNTTGSTSSPASSHSIPNFSPPHQPQPTSLPLREKRLPPRRLSSPGSSVVPSAELPSTLLFRKSRQPSRFDSVVENTSGHVVVPERVKRSLSFRLGMYHPAILLSPDQLWTREEEWTNLFQKFHNKYEAMWNETRRIAASRCVMLYAIPALRRDGLKNVQWKGCEFVYYNNQTASWTFVDMAHLMYDPINGDSVFRVSVPKSHSPALCFVKDKNSEDRDHPGGVCGEEEKRLDVDGNYYCMTSDYINSLRDGEITEGDRISNLGISVRFQDSASTSDGRWDGAVLHYLNESDGHWSERPFNLGVDSTVYLLEAKSATFVIRDRTYQHWLKSPSGMDFRISFPGAYVVYSDGQLFECSLQTLTQCSGTQCR
eukprot:GHVQ01024477.1.p1 GENE.GHVQ01024477.1~~GHVQ01024477.1.p1  ORF type:complete len:655 (+),score=67.75 GHVQ01024477.1:678-2642(+)